jgi:hypothetical protein
MLNTILNQLRNKERIIVSVPTINLLRELYNRLIARLNQSGLKAYTDIFCSYATETPVPDPVSNQIDRFFKIESDGLSSFCVFITDHSLTHIKWAKYNKYIPLDSIILHKDEELRPFVSFAPINIADHYNNVSLSAYLSKHLDCRQSDYGNYDEIVIQSGHAQHIRKWLAKDHPLHQLAQSLLCQYHRVYAKDWMRSNTLSLYGVVDCSCLCHWKETTHYAANFTDLLETHVWRNLDWVERIHSLPKKHILNREFAVAYISDKAMSKTKQAASPDYYDKAQRQYYDKVKAYDPTAKVLFVCNNGTNPVIKRISGGSNQVPFSAAGINDYRNEKHIAITAALQLDHDTRNFYTAVAGMDAQQLYKAIAIQTYYQQLCRINIRDSYGTDLISCLLPDMQTANYLLNLIGS